MVTSIIEEEAIRMKLQMVIPNNVEQLKNVIKRQPKFKRRSPQAVFEIVEEDIKKQ
jgi:transcriptional regulator with AAA-type ATPase domain